jgi:hypothetical protein
LPSNVSSHFAGAHNRYGQSATARIQLRMDLLSESYCSIDLQSYRDNDQKHSFDILKTLKSGQLVIRDLGYWALDCFQRIADQQAFFLSRFKYGPKLRLAGQEDWMTIVDFLNSQREPNKRQIDCIVEIGKSAKLKVRLIALKAPKRVVEQRKAKARKDRNQRANHSKAYFEFLNWTVLITNVGDEIWPNPRQAFDAYAFRWRIECIFKCWKSKFRFAQFFKTHKHLKPNRVQISIYLILILITIYSLQHYLFFLRRVYQKHGRLVSPLKFADFVKQNHEKFTGNKKQLEPLVDTVSYYCTYEVRKRQSYFDQLLNGP